MVIKNSFYYLGSTLVTAMAGIIVLPLYTHVLAVEEFGLYEVLSKLASVVIMFAAMGSINGFARLYFEREERRWKQEVLFTSYLFLTCSSFLMIGLLWLFRGYVVGPFAGGQSIDGLVLVLMAWIPLDILYGLSLATLQVEGKASKYFLLTLAKTSVFLALNVYFLNYLGMGIEGILLANVISIAIFIIPYACIIMLRSQFRFSAKYLTELWRYSLPFLPSALFVYISQSSDRYFLAAFQSVEDVGLYALSAKISIMAVMLVQQAFTKVWYPYLFSIVKESFAKKTIAKVLNAYVSFLIFYCFLVALACPFIISIMASDEYQAAIWLAPVLCLGVLLQSIGYMADYGLLIEKKTQYKPLVAFWVALISVLGNLLLVPTVGVYGAGVIFILSMLLLTVLNLRYSERFYPLGMSYGIHIKHLLLVAILLALTFVFLYPGKSMFEYIVVPGLTLLLYGVIVLCSPFFNSEQREEIRSLVSNLKELK